MISVSKLAIAVTLAGALAGLAGPASAACKRMGFLVNDYGKDGPTNDAKSLLDKHVAQWAAEQGIEKYTIGKKDVKCELFLNLIVVDEHTCTASATVCWGEDAKPAAERAASGEAKSKKKKEVAAESKPALEKAAEVKTEEPPAQAASSSEPTQVETGAIAPAGKVTEEPAATPAATTETPAAAPGHEAAANAAEAAAAAAERAAQAAERAAQAAERAAAAVAASGATAPSMPGAADTAAAASSAPPAVSVPPLAVEGAAKP